MFVTLLVHRFILLSRQGKRCVAHKISRTLSGADPTLSSCDFFPDEAEVVISMQSILRYPVS